MPAYDVIVVGGSVSGLLAAREAAAGGLTVAVLEEDSEVGEHSRHTAPRYRAGRQRN